MNPIRDREEYDVDSWEQYRKSIQTKPVTFYPLGFWIVVMFVLIYSIPAALADDVTLTWTNPTGQETCTDGGPLTNAAGTRIWQLVADINDPNATSYVIPNMVPGTYQYVATTYDTDGDESRVSGKATKVVESFMAPAGSTVYQPVSISSGFWMIPMGTLSADTACDATQRANNYYRVPVSAVTWNQGTTARPVFVVAECG